MGLFTDILKGLPENAVLREKVAEAEKRYAALETENAILRDDLRDAKLIVKELNEQLKELTHKDDLDATEVRLLLAIAHLEYDDAVKAVIARDFPDLSGPRLDYHIKRLEDGAYIRGGVIDQQGIHYAITQDGRTFLLKKDLL